MNKRKNVRSNNCLLYTSYVALSDGMGQGYIAYKESKLTLDVLSQLLKNGIQLRDTLNTLNTLLKIKNQGDMYTTCLLYTSIPVIIRKKFLKIYLTLLQKNDIKAIEDLIATQLAKICIPLFNREYLLLNAYLKVNDNKQIDTQVNNIMDHVPMNSKQKSALAKSVFYIYVDKKNASMIDRLLEMVSTTNDHALYRQMDMVNDTLISGGIKYYDELKSDLEDVEYLSLIHI